MRNAQMVTDGNLAISKPFSVLLIVFRAPCNQLFSPLSQSPREANWQAPLCFSIEDKWPAEGQVVSCLWKSLVPGSSLVG